jgi:hypothetical protein
MPRILSQQYLCVTHTGGGIFKVAIDGLEKKYSLLPKRPPVRQKRQILTPVHPACKVPKKVRWEGSFLI